MGKFYITTPVYYVNDAPHLGHAYTTIAADTISRYKRLCGDKVLFLTGTDEHGNKILQAAKEKGLSPIELADRMVNRFKNLWDKLLISYDDFIRTTEPRHTRVVESIFLKLYEKGDIYKGKYSGWYCVPCESFWLESQLKDGKKCPECGREVIKLEEDSYFFRLSAYQEKLLDYYSRHPDFVQPPTRMREVLEFVKRGLKDLSVTRLNLEWGISCPVDKSHSIYVWIDALINYISALGYSLNEEKFSFFWPADVHLVGKDILKFHAIIWPALLMALDIELPRMVFAHGWWMMRGEKMSKSKKNVIDPSWIVDKFGPDYLRYFLLREVPFGEDGNFSLSLFTKRVNSDLANDLGNLLNRSLHLIIRDYQGKVPSPYHQAPEDEELKLKLNSLLPKVDRFMNNLSFSQALSSIWEIVRMANLYLDRSAPWRLIKNGKKERAGSILYNVLDLMRILSVVLFPFIPRGAGKIWEQLGLQADIEKQNLKETVNWGRLPSGTRVKGASPIFPRIKEENFYEIKREDKVSF
ncbi:methionine--tRNA ligase [Candidatus Aerophobetes bacterium]|uniref:Methionine--tRNA ligase n=1 Tax=Aerophobetes bacterium TaxID=2030807 RepID=A0A662DIT1_UNCAE|nr:MAG: methionine--tRNA ligase [Candidatus Aerophobetes bacterium]